MFTFTQTKKAISHVLFSTCIFSSSLAFATTEFTFDGSYIKGDEVTHNGVTYTAIYNGTGKEPGKTNYWKITSANTGSWLASATYTKGTAITHNGVTYTAVYNGTGKEPGKTNYWKVTSANTGSWLASTTYTKGTAITHNGVTYTAVYNGTGKEPGKTNYWKVTSTNTGSWLASATYTKGTTVTHNDITYVAVYNGTGKEPGKTNYWKVFAIKNDGNWVTNKAYIKGIEVTHNGIRYVAVNNNTDKEPGKTNDWTVVTEAEINTYPIWEAGTTNVEINSKYQYEGNCWLAIHKPGVWETPAEGWFWTETACAGTNVTPPDTSEPEVTTPDTLEPDAKVNNVAFITVRLKGMAEKFENADIIANFNRTKSLVERISYGKETLNLDKIYDLGEIDFDRDQVLRWSQTSSVLARYLRANDRSPYYDDCDLSIDAPKAQAMLDSMSSSDKARKGIVIDKLDLSLVETFSDLACRDLPIGEVFSLNSNLPPELDINAVDMIVFSPFDDVLHAGGQLNQLLYSNFKNINDYDRSRTTQVKMILVGAKPEHIVGSVSLPYMSAPTNMASFLGEKPYLQSNYSDILSHEMAHALGIQTHDNGVHYNLDQVTADAVKTTPINNSSTANLGYGDWFSVVGTGSFASGLSPSSKEFLGWLPGDRIFTYSTDTSGHEVTLSSYDSNEGTIVAKIPLPNNGGYLYATYLGNKQEYSTLQHPMLSNNAKGAMIHWTKDTGRLTTSSLLDMDNNIKNHDFSLKPGQSFELNSVSIEVISLIGDKLTVRVTYL